MPLTSCGKTDPDMWLTGAAHFADWLPVLKRGIQLVNNVEHVYYSCESAGQVAATVNFGNRVRDTNKIAKVYDIVSRYQAYCERTGGAE